MHGAVVREWRQSQFPVPASGYANFLEVYTQPWIDMDDWSVHQLLNEQHDLVFSEFMKRMCLSLI